MFANSLRTALIACVITMTLTSSQGYAKAIPSSPYINKTINAPYLDVGKKEYLLVFYGYVGCVKVCMPILDTITDFYASKEFSPFASKVDFVFVNLLPEVDKTLPDQYAKSFNGDFHGVYLSANELSKIDKELQLFFTKSTKGSLEIDHSDHLYLVQRLEDQTFKLITIYTTHPFTKEYILEDLQTFLEKK